jgi:hypothetical protein
MTTPSITTQAGINALESLDRHWAVKVVTPEDRAAAIRFGMGVMTRLSGGESVTGINGDDTPDFVVPLAGAYVIAASEWLDFEGSAAPSAMLSEEQEAQRTAHIEAGADRAFVLTAALPVEADERVAALYRTLLLAGLAQLGHKQTEFRHWLRAHERFLFPRVVNEEDGRWDIVLLRRVVELWTHLLRAAGPSGLEHAMEIVASIREDRPIREPAFLAGVDAADVGRTRFYLFTLFHLVEAATELLLFRLHGEPERIETRLYSHFTLARNAAGGDPRLDASFDWLYEASRRVVQQRTSQLELLPESSN